MNIFDKLSEDERIAITNYIADYAGDEGEGTHVKADLQHILRIWNKEKAPLCKLLGDNLIVTKTINFTRSSEMLEEQVYEELVGTNRMAFVDDFLSIVNRLRSLQQTNFEEDWGCRTLISTDSLVSNIYTSDIDFDFKGPKNERISVRNGCKVMKVLGKIAKAYGLEDTFEEFRLKHSMILNQKTMKGKLCISIHPLDFMTMSDNYSNWESCMSWANGGSYRQGTVEMMNSPYVVVAYLASEGNPYNAGGMEWSNKKWRQLFVVHPNLLLGIKAYPYQNDECTGIVLNTLRELAQRNMGWGPYCEEAVRIDNESNNTFASLNLVSRIDLQMHHMYNDICEGHLGYISLNFPESFYLMLSGESECMSCGELFDPYDESHLVCDNCEERITCCCCGERLCNDEVFYFDDDDYRENPYCEYCFNEEAITCAVSEMTIARCHSEEIYFSYGDIKTGYSVNIEPGQLNRDRFKKLFGSPVQEEAVYSPWYTPAKIYVDGHNFSEKGWEAFENYTSVAREDYQTEEETA